MIDYNKKSLFAQNKKKRVLKTWSLRKVPAAGGDNPKLPKLAYHEGISNIPCGVYWLYITTQRPATALTGTIHKAKRELVMSLTAIIRLPVRLDRNTSTKTRLFRGGAKGKGAGGEEGGKEQRG